MKILLTGAAGQVGFELARALAPLGEVIALDRAALDLTDVAAVRHTVRSLGPQLIVNAAAYTAVDRAESEVARAQAVNADAPGWLAEEAARLRAPIVHYSTDYVFDGRKGAPYAEIDAPHPLNVYGATKLDGERRVAAANPAHLILRVSWVYGLRGRNFLRTMLAAAEAREEIAVVDDQIGTPTWSRLVAEATLAMLAQGKASGALREWTLERAGIYHLACGGQVSWYGFAKAIFAHWPKPRRLRLKPISSEEWPSVAARPSYSVLECTRASRVFGIALPSWETALALCLAELREHRGQAFNL